MPLAAVTGKAAIVDARRIWAGWARPGGNPVACVAALKAIEIVERDNLSQRRADRRDFHGALRAWRDKYDIVGDVRRLGAMTAVEFVKGSQRSQCPTPMRRSRSWAGHKSRAAAHPRRALLNCVRTLVPLTINDAELEEGLGVLEESIAAVM